MKQQFWLMIASAIPLLCSTYTYAKDTLYAGERLNSNEYLTSANGSYRFILQGDGNLVLRNAASESLWSSATHGMGGVRLSMQTDGNLVLYTSQGTAVWSSKTAGRSVSHAIMLDNGNFALRTSANAIVWSTNTTQGGSDSPTISNIRHIGTTQVWDSNGQGVRINRPSGTQPGDLLVLVLHRTDDVLPYSISGWNRAAECYKEDNGYQCLTIPECSSSSSGFCTRFLSKYNGRDLAQVVFTRPVGSNEASAYTFNLNQDDTGHPGWAIMTALRGASTTAPVRAWAHRGCDNDADSVFPSVSGRKGDMLLLSQSFDDAVSSDKFGAPTGMTTLGYVSNSDESGFLYGRVLTTDGETGSLQTTGSGASNCKDAMISLTIRPQ